MAADLGFTVRTLEAFHLAFAGSTYWEGYRGGPDAARFELKPGWRTVYATTVEAVVFKLTLADGSVGWGEATVPIAPETAAHIATVLFAPLLAGRTFEDPPAMWDFLYDIQRGRGYLAGYNQDAAAGIDIAAWDAVGRREGVPVAHLLWDAPRARIPVYLSGVRRPTRRERIDHLKQWRDGGLTAAKLFFDADTVANAEVMAALQAGVPGIRHWMVDVLWSLDETTAPVAKKTYGDLGARWLECPIVPEDIDAHRDLVKLPGAPIAIGEHAHTHFETQSWFRAPRALDVFQPDVGRTGLSDGRRQKALADAAGVPTTPHMGSAGSIFQAATLAFSAGCPDVLPSEFQAGLADLASAFVDTAWQYADGAFTVPDRPGLGVTVDEAAMAPFVRPRSIGP